MLRSLTYLRIHACALYRRPRQGRQAGGPNEDYSPLSGQDYFAQALAVQVKHRNDDNSKAGPSTFRVYYTPPSSASSGTQHGGGASQDEEEDEESSVVFVCHHGAGYSAMSFALLAKEIAEASKGSAGILALDCRGHGMSRDMSGMLRVLPKPLRIFLFTGKTACHDEHNLSIDTLADDLVQVLSEVFPDKCSSPDLILVGHSMVSFISHERTKQYTT